MKNILSPSFLFSTLAAGAFALGMSACGDGGEAESAAASAEPLPEIKAVLLDAAPESEAVSVIEARKEVTPGAEITVVGRVGGAMEPFSESFATLVLADDTLETCDKIPGDSCPTPWDACCALPETIKASRLSVQISDADGKPMTQTLKGAGGLKELDSIIVTGTVAEGSTAENLIVNATGIYRKPS